jgi:hypothetical protein
MRLSYDRGCADKIDHIKTFSRKINRDMESSTALRVEPISALQSSFTSTFLVANIHVHIDIFSASTLCRVLTLKKRHSHDLEIKNQTPIFHVPDVVVNPLR